MRNSPELNQRIQKYLKEGYRIEDMVANLLVSSIGGTTWKASKHDDCKNHIDIWWRTPIDKLVGIDVKGIRRKRASDAEVDDTIQWIEIQNTQGNSGWLYGKMDYIAFVTKSTVLFVTSKALQDWTDAHVDKTNITSINPDADYICYQRKNRKDIIYRMPTSDLYRIAQFEIKMV